MYIFFTVIVFLAAILMILIVLMQNSKGGGLASDFASSNQIMGVRKTTDILEKATWTLAGIIILLSVVSTAFIGSSNNSERESIIKEEVNNSVTVDPNLVAPDFGEQK